MPITKSQLQHIQINNTKIDTVDLMYPIDSRYETTDKNFNPNTYFGGDWEYLEDESNPDENLYVWKRVPTVIPLCFTAMKE